MSTPPLPLPAALLSPFHVALRGLELWAAASFIVAVLLTDLGFNLVGRRGQQSADPEPILRTPRLIELAAAAEAHLVALRLAYKQGGYSGHPEDQLWDIEYAEKRVGRLRSGTR